MLTKRQLFVIITKGFLNFLLAFEPYGNNVSFTLIYSIVQHLGVKLAGGTSKIAGRVEFVLNGTRGTFCDKDWGLKESLVVCRYLGFG